jgi:DNA-binding transcriptional LysR family regulator
VITASGERLLRSAEATETELIQAERDLSREGVDVSGTVRIAAPDGFATFFLCSSLAKLRNQLPSLNIQLFPM